MSVAGDKSWIIAAVYFAVAAAALYAGRAGPDPLERTFWNVAAVLLIAFGLAKYLQVQGEFTNWIRTQARAYHVYDERKLAEYPFLVIVAGVVLFLGVRFRRRFARCGARLVIASLAFLLLTAFLLIRATSVHAIDPLMYKTILGFRNGWWAELGFLLVIAGAAVLRVRKPSPN